MSLKIACYLFVTLNYGFLTNEADAFSVSVPPVRSVCKNMTPGHDKYKPQQPPSPYNITTDIVQVQGGEAVEVTIYARDENKFKGFYIQARDEKGVPIGTFNENTNAKTHSCGGIKSNAAHHVNSEPKEKVQVSWKAPENWKGIIQIQATVVQSYTTFWTPLKAHSITVIP